MPDRGPAEINGHTPVSPNHARTAKAREANRTNHGSTELAQARQIQSLAHKLTMALEPELAALSAPLSQKAKAIDHAARRAELRSLSIALRQAVAAWESASDRVRIARGKPLPGSLRPEQPKAKTQKPKPGSHWTEQPEAQTPENPPPKSLE